VYIEHRIVQLGQGKNIRDKVHKEDWQASSWIKGNTSSPELLTTHITKNYRKSKPIIIIIANLKYNANS
jgi:hypothetical protein